MVPRLLLLFTELLKFERFSNSLYTQALFSHAGSQLFKMIAEESMQLKFVFYNNTDDD